MPWRILLWILCAAGAVLSCSAADPGRLRLILETDAGGDPDDEQSLVRFLLYANEWDVEGIIANRPSARAGENRNAERTGLGIVRRQLTAYRECYPFLKQHDARYPHPDELWKRTVAGYNEVADGVRLIVAAVDRADERPLWYSDWGTDHGASTNNLRRALDQVWQERGAAGYAQFKQRLRLSSADAFGEHTTHRAPLFALWVDTFRPPVDGKRWYHRFSALTAKAGGFDLWRDCLTGHGPLGALYPTNTTHWQKEGDTLTFLYLVPTGLNEPEQPAWGSWAGRYGPNENHPGAPYFWANQIDDWDGTRHRDQSLARWAAALQNDFKARLDWCVRDRAGANHPPLVRVGGNKRVDAQPGEIVKLDASASGDPDGDRLEYEWVFYPEVTNWNGPLPQWTGAREPVASMALPASARAGELHVILAVTDTGTPRLTRYARVIIRVRGP